MQIGMTLPTMVRDVNRDTMLDWCARIDAGGYSSLAVGERVTFHNWECLVSLAAAAAVTERVQIVSTIFVSPMHSACWLAKVAWQCAGRRVSSAHTSMAVDQASAMLALGATTAARASVVTAWPG